VTLFSSRKIGDCRVPTDPLVEVRRISKSYPHSSVILDDVSFTINRGEMVALIGASGSGKSTLIRSIAGLVPVNSNGTGEGGEIALFGKPMQRNGRICGDAKALRARTGVVFQQFNLVPRLSVLTNVCLGSMGRMPFIQGMCGRFSHDDKSAAMQAMSRVGIAEQALKRGADLSGGQQQRAAIARTIVQGAELVIADEPIASLDPGSARRVMDLLADMNRRDGITVLVSLHQVEYALRYCARAIGLRGGRVVYDGPTSALTPALLTSIYGAESSDLLLPAAESLPTAWSGREAARDIAIAASAA
jgi:phosphonate transport system ATP-binding protein